MTDSQPILSSPLYQVGATLIFIVTALLISVNIIASLQIEMTAGNAIELFVMHLPSLCYLAAIGCAPKAFKHFTSSHVFDEVLPKTLHRIGLFCTVGSVFHIFGQMAILRVLGKTSSFLTFDAGAIALMSIGVILVMLARLCERAILMQQDLFEIV